MKFFAYTYDGVTVGVQRYDLERFARVAGYPETKAVAGPYDAPGFDQARRKGREILQIDSGKNEHEN